MAKPPSTEYNWAQATRDVLIASMNRGQLPILGLIGVVALVIWRMTPEKVSEITAKLVEDVEKGYLVGYLLFMVTLCAWFLQAKAARKAFSREYKRVGVEKSELQSKLAGEKFRSSDDK